MWGMFFIFFNSSGFYISFDSCVFLMSSYAYWSGLGHVNTHTWKHVHVWCSIFCIRVFDFFGHTRVHIFIHIPHNLNHKVHTTKLANRSGLERSYLYAWIHMIFPSFFLLSPMYFTVWIMWCARRASQLILPRICSFLCPATPTAPVAS